MNLEVYEPIWQIFVISAANFIYRDGITSEISGFNDATNISASQAVEGQDISIIAIEPAM